MKLTFFGHAAFGLEVAGRRCLIDPYPNSPRTKAMLEDFASKSCDIVPVTHAGYDHMGIALDLARPAGGPKLVSEMAVIEYARIQGLKDDRIDQIGWNSEKTYGPWHVRAVEAKHWSKIVQDDGPTIRGIPLGLIVWHDKEPDMRVYHLGDTSIFSDLGLYGQFYGPTVALVGIAGATAGRHTHMTPSEGAQACLWMGVHAAFPVHWVEEDRAQAQAFCTAVGSLPRKVTTWVPEIGEAFEVTHEVRIARG